MTLKKAPLSPENVPGYGSTRPVADSGLPEADLIHAP